jgi:light-regulated signal transduction histidine kinase (bacteriophytochrome)
MVDTTLKNARILIVDDNQANVDVLSGLLDVHGYENVMALTDPRLVEDVMKSFEPDLILLDLLMPYLSGYQVMDLIKSMIPADFYLPVLILTADITPEAKQLALSQGAKDFLSKPYDLIEVSLRIKNLLETKYLHQQLQIQNQILEEKVKERTLELENLNLQLMDSKEKTEHSERELYKLNQELEQRISERTFQLEAANKELEAFSYSVSHDLRAPLRHISGFIQILKELNAGQQTEEELRLMKLISNGALEMEKLIEALLYFSRINHSELRKTTINSDILVNQVIEVLYQEGGNRKITFSVGKMLNCEGDEQLIKQVWVNLISNAIKYTGRNPDATIEIGSYQSDDELTFFIKDNGVGFDMKNAGRLFGVFRRLHTTRDFEGIGIGLANVNSIVTRHGGRCTAMGEVGKGATFQFTMPGAALTVNTNP